MIVTPMEEVLCDMDSLLASCERLFDTYPPEWHGRFEEVMNKAAEMEDVLLTLWEDLKAPKHE